MATPTPNLLPLYPPYLAAFNAHSWPAVKSFISPTCHGTVRGKLSTTSRDEMWPHYEKDFQRCERHEVCIKEIKQVRREASAGDEEWMRGIEWGLYLELWDPEMRRTLWLNYWYREEGQGEGEGEGERRWLQVWHELLDVVVQPVES